MLPFLFDIYCFSFTGPEYRTRKIIHAISKLKIQILTVPEFDFNSKPVHETMSIIQIYTDIKVLKIQHFCDSQIFTDDELNFINTTPVYFEQLIVNYSSSKFQVLELLLKHMPNLKIFSMFAPDKNGNG